MMELIYHVGILTPRFFSRNISFLFLSYPNNNITKEIMLHCNVSEKLSNFQIDFLFWNCHLHTINILEFCGKPKLFIIPTISQGPKPFLPQIAPKLMWFQ